MRGITEGRTTLAAVTAVILMAAVLPGCAKRTAAVIDIRETAKALLTGVGFEDELARLDSEAVEYLYGTDDYAYAEVYVGSGATAEEVAVFDAGTEEGGKEMLDIAKKHIADQMESYRDYDPEEAKRLEKAVVTGYGRYVIVCVTDDTAAAKEIIDNAIT